MGEPGTGPLACSEQVAGSACDPSDPASPPDLPLLQSSLHGTSVASLLPRSLGAARCGGRISQ